MINRWHVLLLTILVAGLAACGSSGGEESSHDHVPAESPTATHEVIPAPAETVIFTARGTVRSVTPTGSHVVIHHENIPGFMEAMTMPFDVPDSVEVRHLERDDRIEFTFISGPVGTAIQSVTVVE